MSLLETFARGLEVAGVTAPVIRREIASLRFARRLKCLGLLLAYDRYRQSIGRVVLVGLEVLVAASIIKTIPVEPSPRQDGGFVSQGVLELVANANDGAAVGELDSADRSGDVLDCVHVQGAVAEGEEEAACDAIAHVGL